MLDRLKAEVQEWANGPEGMHQLVLALLEAQAPEPQNWTTLFRAIKAYVLHKRQYRRWLQGRGRCPLGGHSAINALRNGVELLLQEIRGQIGSQATRALTRQMGRAMNGHYYMA